MNFRSRIFCCPSVYQCGQTPASHGLKLEPFMAWARPKTALEGSTGLADNLHDLLIETVLTNADCHLPTACVPFIIGKDQDGNSLYRKFLAMRTLRMELHEPAEDSMMLVYNNRQLSYTVSWYQTRPSIPATNLGKELKRLELSVSIKK